MQGNYAEAEKIFLQVIEISPRYVLGHYGLGKVYLYQEGRLDDAVSELKTAVSLDHSFAKADFYLGFAYLFRHNYPHAIRAFSDAYQKDKDLIEALYNIGMIYDLMDSPVKCRYYYVKWYSKKLKKENDEIDFGY